VSRLSTCAWLTRQGNFSRDIQLHKRDECRVKLKVLCSSEGFESTSGSVVSMCCINQVMWKKRWLKRVGVVAPIESRLNYQHVYIRAQTRWCIKVSVISQVGEVNGNPRERPDESGFGKISIHRTCTDLAVLDFQHNTLMAVLLRIQVRVDDQTVEWLKEMQTRRQQINISLSDESSVA
jgi:hypothetical protein